AIGVRWPQRPQTSRLNPVRNPPHAPPHLEGRLPVSKYRGSFRCGGRFASHTFRSLYLLYGLWVLGSSQGPANHETPSNRLLVFGLLKSIFVVVGTILVCVGIVGFGFMELLELHDNASDWTETITVCFILLIATHPMIASLHRSLRGVYRDGMYVFVRIKDKNSPIDDSDTKSLIVVYHDV
ncbi:hypothetical protein PENTCL1PPCAC_24160, partial [Pristionchus entomophagus]